MLEVLRSGQLSLGPRVPAFEAAFAEQVGARHACAVSSGTAALHLALRAIGVAAGDEVVTTPFSFVATANAVVYEGATPVFADIDPVTLDLDPDAAAAAITGRTSALLPVHIFGWPADMPAFERHGLPIVEDAAQALGARYADGAPVGGRGHPAIFGFYANKQLTTGEGGMVTLGSAEHKVRIDSERNQGARARHGLARPRPPRLQLPALRPRVRARPRAARAARRHARRPRPCRRAGTARRSPGWRRSAGVALPCPDAGGNVRGWFVFVVQLPDGVDRDATMIALREHGVQSKPYLPAIHLMSLYRERFGHRPGEFPVCERVAGPVAGAAVLPGHDAGSGRARRRRARPQVIAA